MFLEKNCLIWYNKNSQWFTSPSAGIAVANLELTRVGATKHEISDVLSVRSGQNTSFCICLFSARFVIFFLAYFIVAVFPFESASLTERQWRIQDFPEVGAPTLGEGGRQHMILPNFPKNWKNLDPGGGPPMRSIPLGIRYRILNIAKRIKYNESLANYSYFSQRRICAVYVFCVQRLCSVYVIMRWPTLDFYRNNHCIILRSMTNYFWSFSSESIVLTQEAHQHFTSTTYSCVVYVW